MRTNLLIVRWLGVEVHFTTHTVEQGRLALLQELMRKNATQGGV